jgi:FKBP12-rapamycin complex-associated protein
MSILRTEQIQSIRLEAVKVIGVLGALDPYRQKLASTGDDELLASNPATKEDAADEVLLFGPAQSEDYFPTVAIAALIRILKDPSLSVYHSSVVQALINIFETLGLKCVPFLPQVI